MSLDSEEILKKFYEERGLTPDHFNRDTNSKIVISVKEKSSQSNPTLMITIALIAVLAGFSFFANKKGWISTPHTTPVTDSTLVSSIDSSKAVNDPLLNDSLYSGAPVQVADSMKSADSTKNSDSTLSKPVDKKAMKFRLEVSTDSVWAQIFSDGQSWKSTIVNGTPKEFTAFDSFNVHIANNPKVKYILNGKPLVIKGNGTVFFKLDNSSSPIPWGNSRWISTFKGRL